MKLVYFEELIQEAKHSHEGEGLCPACFYEGAHWGWLQATMGEK